MQKIYNQKFSRYSEKTSLHNTEIFYSVHENRKKFVSC